MSYSSDLFDFFHQYRNSPHAVAMERYMKNNFSFLGIKTPERRNLLREFIRTHGLPAKKELPAVVQELFEFEQREFHYCAVELTKRMLKLPEYSDLPVIEFLLNNHQWWDTIDLVASNVAGRWMWHNPQQRLSVFQRWNESNNMWLNRSAILYQLKYRERTDLKLLSKAILRHAPSKEFFLRKAIGWSLREYAKTDPDWVRKFVAAHQLSPLSAREALKNLN